jgi:hypothetical protein
MHVYSYLNEKFEYTKCVIRSHKSKRTNNTTATGKRTNNTTARGKGQTIQRLKEKDKQYNGYRKRTNNTTAKGKGQTIQRLKEKDKQYNG